jgi:hypothetical protein
MGPYITPYNEANVIANQPWLTVEEHEQMKLMGSRFFHVRNPQVETWMVDHLEIQASEGDQAAIERLNPHCRFILTTDFRVIQEPNLPRWQMFMERSTHRFIDLTLICNGREPKDHGQEWKRTRRSNVPSFKIEETFVSTVFLGKSEKQLFETMIFGGWLNHVFWRRNRLEAAKQCHWEAVMLAHQLKRYMKQHGRSVRKDWIRLEEFWRLAEKRGSKWMLKHVPVMDQLECRLIQVPGRPVVPCPNFFLDLIMYARPRQKVGA